MELRQPWPILEVIWGEVWESVKHLAAHHTYHPGVYLMRQGEPSATVYFVKSGGTVKIVCADDGGEQVITDMHSAGWIFGVEAAMEGMPYECSAIPVNSCEVAALPSADFLKLVQTSSALSWYLHRMQSSEVANLVVQQMVLRTAGSRKRYAHFLCKLLSASGQAFSREPVRIQILLKQHEVAQMVSITPEHLCRVAKKMESQGVIRREKSSLIVCNPIELSRSIHFS